MISHRHATTTESTTDHSTVHSTAPSTDHSADHCDTDGPVAVRETAQETGRETGHTAATTRTVLRSSEFTCPSCVAKIERQLRRIPGVQTATVHFNTGRIEVDHDPRAVTVRDLVDAVARAGYRATPAAW